MGSAEIPQSSNITIKYISYKYEKAKFDEHKKAFASTKEMLTTGKVFGSQLAIPIYQLTKTSLELLDESTYMINELEKLSLEDYSIGLEPPLTTTVDSLARTSWFHDTDFNDLRILAGQLAVDKDYDFNGLSDTDPTEQKIVNNMVLFHGELTKYHNDLSMLLQLFSSLRNQKLTEDVRQILQEQLFTGLYLQSRITSTFFRVKDQTISFSIKAIVYSEVKIATKYKSIPYFGQKIAGQYYTDTAGTRLFAIECHNHICAEKHPDQCGQSLFSNDLTGILFNCTFATDESEFDITPKGIFVYKEPSEKLRSLLDDHGLTAQQRPFLAQFSGCYHIPQGSTTIHGCLNLPIKQITPKFDISTIDNYFDPYFLIKVFKYLKDFPLLSILLILPTSVILIMCAVKAVFCKICCSKPDYRKTPEYERAPRLTHRRKQQQTQDL